MTDVGGLNDKSFNALAYKGLKDALKKLGIDGRVFISKPRRLHPEPHDRARGSTTSWSASGS